MKIKKLPKLNLRLDFSEKFNSNKQVIMRTQEEIDSYKKAIGYRKARVKRYGKIPAKKAR
jgi:hypothetical protein